MFSVIIPVYNKKPHIKRCINSVLNQTYSQYEIIIIDDNSTDGSFEEIQKYNDPRIQVFRRSEPGPGGYAARNLGIEKAKYDWIAFLDADDEWYPNHLEKVSSVINKVHESGIIGAGFKSISENKEIIQPYYIQNKTQGVHRVTLVDFLEIYLRNQRYCNTSVTVVKKKILKEVGGFPDGKTNKGGDLYTWIKVFSICDGFWSPHIGANTYHNAINKVTHSSYFNIEFLKGITNELNLSYPELTLLKKYINSLIIKDYIRYLANEKKKGFSLIKTVYTVDTIQMIRCLLLDFVPAIILYRVINIKRSILKN